MGKDKGIKEKVDGRLGGVRKQGEAWSLLVRFL
jgi:hypothetical protein